MQVDIPLEWNVTRVDTINVTDAALSATGRGTAAAAAEVRRTLHYAHLLDFFVFYPVAFETMGSWALQPGKYRTL